VEDAQGKAIPQPDGDQMTPLRLEDVAAGSYRITLSQAANRQQVVACDISPANHLCTAVLDQPDLLQAIEGTPR